MAVERLLHQDPLMRVNVVWENYYIVIPIVVENKNTQKVKEKKTYLGAGYQWPLKGLCTKGRTTPAGRCSWGRRVYRCPTLA